MIHLLIALAAAAASPTSQPTKDPYSGGFDDPSPAPAPVTPSVAADDVARARKVFMDKLRDPSGTRVRGFQASTVRLSDGQTPYCGEINGKNAYGGMTGWHLVCVKANGEFREDDTSDLLERVIVGTMAAKRSGPDLTATFTPGPGD